MKRLTPIIAYKDVLSFQVTELGSGKNLAEGLILGFLVCAKKDGLVSGIVLWRNGKKLAIEEAFGMAIKEAEVTTTIMNGEGVEERPFFGIIDVVDNEYSNKLFTEIVDTIGKEALLLFLRRVEKNDILKSGDGK